MRRCTSHAASLVLSAALGLAAPAAAAPPAAATPPNADRSGVVLIEQGGKVVALGTLLNEDGRVLTSLSRLSEQLPTFVRHASGGLEPARVGHADRERDLALLVPKVGRVRQGVKASRGGAPPAAKPLGGFSVGPNRSLTATPIGVKSATRVGGRSALELASAPKPVDLGGPLLDDAGNAVAILVSGCLGSAAAAQCDRVPVGLEVSEVRAFLRGLPATAELSVPWLGLRGVSADTGVVRGVRITEVEAGSPAAQAGLRAGADFSSSDLLVAVAGEPVPSAEALRARLGRHAAGDRVDLLIYGKNGYKTVTTRLIDRPAGQRATPPGANGMSAGASPGKVTPPSAAGSPGSKAK